MIMITGLIKIVWSQIWMIYLPFYNYNTCPYLIVWHKDVLERYHHPNQGGLRVKAEGAENHHFLGQEGEDHETQKRV